MNEIKHRVKNTLAIIQAIAVRTFRQAPPEERDSFIARLHALASTHDLLSEEKWDRAAVAVIVRRALAPFQDRGQERFRLEGPETLINADKSVLLAMALHELATNAVKYGSLSNQAGQVSIRWELMNGAQGPQLKLQWREAGGPPVAPPTRKGFGTGLIERAFNHQGAAQFEFRPDGMTCTVQLEPVTRAAEFNGRQEPWPEDLEAPAPGRASAGSLHARRAAPAQWARTTRT